LSAQSAQQIIGEVYAAIDSCHALPRSGHAEARYPWRLRHYRDVFYTNQEARLRDGNLMLPHGKRGTLRIRVPDSVTLSGRLMEARLSYGAARLICEKSDEARRQESVIVVDPGVNTVSAATDRRKIIRISGRAAKATFQFRNWQLACLQQAHVRNEQGSHRRTRLKRRRYQMLGTTARRVRGLCHKATRQAPAAFPSATCCVGEPFNEAAQRIRRVQSQQVGTTCTRKISSQLTYKTAGACTLSEAYSSQTCPVCGERSKQRRIRQCPKCGVAAPGDSVVAVKILSLGRHGAMYPCRALPQRITYLRPLPRSQSQPRSSSGGRPAYSSA
jgi:putative transposase